MSARLLDALERARQRLSLACDGRTVGILAHGGIDMECVVIHSHEAEVFYHPAVVIAMKSGLPVDPVGIEIGGLVAMLAEFRG